MGSCNGCASCCSPVVLDLNYHHYALSWAGEPLPDEAPEGYYEGKGQDITDPEVVSKITEHILNGRHFAEHFRPRFITQSGIALDCEWFDTTTRRCTHYEERPPVCAGYPWYDKPPKLKGDKPLPPLCSYWEDIEISKRPENWRLIAEPEMQDLIHRFNESQVDKG